MPVSHGKNERGQFVSSIAQGTNKTDDASITTIDADVIDKNCFDPKETGATILFKAQERQCPSN